MVYIVVKDLKNNNVVFDIHYPGPYLKNVLESNVLVKSGSVTEKNLVTVITAINNDMNNIVNGYGFQYYISPELLNRYFKFSFSENLFFVDPNDVITEKDTKQYVPRFNGYIGGFRNGFDNFTRENSIFQNRESWDIKNQYNKPFASNNNVNSRYDFLEMYQNGVYHLKDETDIFILSYNTYKYEIECIRAIKKNENNAKPLKTSDKFIILPTCYDNVINFALTNYFVKLIKKFIHVDKLEIKSKNIVVSEDLIKVLILFNNELENGLLENNLVSVKHNKTYGEMLNIKNTGGKGIRYEEETEKPVKNSYDVHKSLIREILVKNKVDFSPDPTITHKDTFTFTFHNEEQYILFWSGYYVKTKPTSNPKRIGNTKLKDLNNIFRSLECLKSYDVFMSTQEKKKLL